MNTVVNKWTAILVSSAVIAASAAGYLFFAYQKSKKRITGKRNKKRGSVNIGAIFGMDVGGTLTKIVYFEAKREEDISNVKINTKQPFSESTPQQSPARMTSRKSSESLKQLDSPDHKAALEQLYTYMSMEKNNYTNNSVRSDDNLSIYSQVLGGRLHFLHFETRNMVSAIQYMSSTALIENINTIGCTGGGAHKYATEFEEQLGISFNKFDELRCLIWGMHFALINFPDECYTYRNVDIVEKQGIPASDAKEAAAGSANTAAAQEEEIDNTPISVKRWQKDAKEYTSKVVLPYESVSSSFPYLLVNIGSGVSILKVTSPGEYSRVSGTSLGGGTYWGLCRLLTKCATYEDVLDLAEMGNAGVVDMLVRDIYGGDYGGLLSGSMVASSFGKLVMKENPWEGVREEDIALALLMMITNNIGQVAHLNAQLHNCNKIFFVGSFLRHNPISCRRLAFAIDFWSGSQMEALFSVHEGYFGALGTFLQSAFGEDLGKILFNQEEEESSNGKTIFPGWRKRTKSATDAQLQSAASSLSDLLRTNKSAPENPGSTSNNVSDSNSVSSDASRNVSRANTASPALRRRSSSEETPAGGTNIGSLDSLFKAAVP